MTGLNTSFNRTVLLPFLFCLAIIIGPAYNMYVHYDFSHSNDTESYLAMSNGNWNVNPVHRYRLIIPVTAKIISLPLELVYTKIWPHRAESLWPLQLSYFILNTFLCALFGWIVYRLLKTYTNHLAAICIGLTGVLSSRWISYMAGLPLTDSLYLVVIAAFLLSIQTNNKILFLITVLSGALVKESFLLFAPFILLIGPYRWPVRLLLVFISTCLLFAEHALIDSVTQSAAHSSSVNQETLWQTLIRTTDNIAVTFHKLSGVRGLGELFTVIGVFSFIILYGSIHAGIRTKWKLSIKKQYWIFFGCILMHAFLSRDAGRMLYFASPVYAVLIALAIEKIIADIRIKKEG